MDTIFALSTVPGKSGIAVIRLSGPGCAPALAALGVPLPRPRLATLAALCVQGNVIDKGLVLYFPAPHSFTGEDIIEFQIHGGRAVIAALLGALAALPGLRPALPGEFARRAFFNGKMDLTAAEGLADLIDADTEAQRKQALRSMEGEAAAFYTALRKGIVEALAYLEAYIDFPDEEIPPEILETVQTEVSTLKARIHAQLATAASGEKIRDGVRVAIIGPPNAGKSSLLNWLAARDVAIVSDIAGTTRDVIEVQLDIDGRSVIVFDTAGIREHENAVEAEGIRRSLAHAGSADLKLLVLDATEAARQLRDPALASLIDARTLILVNKSEQMPDDVLSGLPFPHRVSAPAPLAISLHQRTGLEAFMMQLKSSIHLIINVEYSFVTRARHHYHLTRAIAHLEQYSSQSHLALELRCEELRRAAVEIGAITGIIASDEVLGTIFSRFCIGK